MYQSASRHSHARCACIARREMPLWKATIPRREAETREDRAGRFSFYDLETARGFAWQRRFPARLSCRTFVFSHLFHRPYAHLNDRRNVYRSCTYQTINDEPCVNRRPTKARESVDHLCVGYDAPDVWNKYHTAGDLQKTMHCARKRHLTRPDKTSYHQDMHTYTQNPIRHLQLLPKSLHHPNLLLFHSTPLQSQKPQTKKFSNTILIIGPNISSYDKWSN